ncbi:MAG: DNA cytosine methyltransferase [Anaerolineae bacterium]|nr:DNA cytosine methyltransferase [Anaerolineae bacterium]
MPAKNSFPTITDQFCGAGGSSLGASMTGAEIKLALNHWKLAVETHNTNFPKTLHDCTDISAVDPRRYPSTDILITSPECTNHSVAKGVKRKNMAYATDIFGNQIIDPAEERSRATMWDVPRFAEYHDYNLIIVENVVDARNWRLFDAWLHAMHALDYDHECVYFNSMFAHPTPQSRDRMYVIFWKRGNKRPNLRFEPRAYCEHCQRDVDSFQSWKKPSKTYGKYGPRNQYEYRCPQCRQVVTPYYYCAANAIDWSIPGERIGDRKKPLKPRTIERIEYGLKKFGAQAMTVQTDFAHSTSPRTRAVSEVMPTQTGRQVLALLLPFLTSTNYFSERSVPVDEAMPTQTTSGKLGVTIPPMIFSSNAGGKGDHPVRDVSQPLPTQVASGQPWMVSPFLIANDRRTRATDVIEPLPFASADREPKLIIPPFILTHGRDFSTKLPSDALSTIVGAGNHHFVVSPVPFIVEMYNTSFAREIIEALGTMTTVGHHGLAQPGETPAVDDCYFRMLRPEEIGRGMAFPDTYVVRGNQRDRIRQYGNAVTPPVMQMLVERCVEALG